MDQGDIFEAITNGTFICNLTTYLSFYYAEVRELIHILLTVPITAIQ
jgi:hypothetical protein